jgi:hypothetical protein
MNTQQPKALQLADEIGTQVFFSREEAAAELRRLHNEVTDLKQALEIADAVFKERDKLDSVNAELLEALKWMVENDETNEGDDPVECLGGHSWNEYNSYWINGLNKARAAIAKATGE